MNVNFFGLGRDVGIFPGFASKLGAAFNMSFVGNDGTTTLDPMPAAADQDNLLAYSHFQDSGFNHGLQFFEFTTVSNLASRR